MQVAIWGTALALTAPFLVAVRKIIDYPFLLRAPAEYVERVVLADRLFFVLYGMLATALVVALLWDSLSPTRHDHEIVGVLPVHPRTLAAARFTAAVGVGLAFALAVTAPSALLYSAASAAHPARGRSSRACWLGHLRGDGVGVRVRVPVDAGRSRADPRRRRRRRGRAASPWRCRSLTFVLLVQVFFFLPGILPELLKDAPGRRRPPTAACRRCGSRDSSSGSRTAAPSRPGLVLWSAVAVAGLRRGRGRRQHPAGRADAPPRSGAPGRRLHRPDDALRAGRDGAARGPRLRRARALPVRRRQPGTEPAARRAPRHLRGAGRGGRAGRHRHQPASAAA